MMSDFWTEARGEPEPQHLPEPTISPPQERSNMETWADAVRAREAAQRGLGLVVPPATSGVSISHTQRAAEHRAYIEQQQRQQAETWLSGSQLSAAERRELATSRVTGTGVTASQEGMQRRQAQLDRWQANADAQDEAYAAARAGLIEAEDATAVNVRAIRGAAAAMRPTHPAQAHAAEVQANIDAGVWLADGNDGITRRATGRIAGSTQGYGG